MLKNTRDGIKPGGRRQARPGEIHRRPEAPRANLVAYVGDVVGTGSSRKSATNSVLWFTGEDIPFVPNKRFGGVTWAARSPHLLQHAGRLRAALPIELDVSQMNMGDVIDMQSPTTARSLKMAKSVPSSRSRVKCCLTKCAPAAAFLIIGRG